MESILITGLDGFVGSYLNELLHQQYPQFKIQGTFLYQSPNFNTPTICHKCDLLNRSEIFELVKQIKPKKVFHLAGVAYVPDAEDNPTISLEVNGIGSFNLFDALAQNVPDTRIITVSSSNVYGKQYFNQNLIESVPIEPHNIYGLSKAVMEQFANYFYREKKLSVIVMRAFNHIGPRQSDKFVVSNFAKQIAEIEKQQKPPKIYVGDLSVVRDFTDVRDIVYGYYLAMENGQSGDVYNICRGKGYDIQSLLEKLLEFSSLKIEICQDPQRLRNSEIPYLVGSHDKLRASTGWVPQYDILDTLKDILEYWRDMVSRNPLG